MKFLRRVLRPLLCPCVNYRRKVAPVPSVPVVFDPDNHGGNVFLSNADLTANVMDNADWSRGIAVPLQSTGKRVIKMTGIYAPYLATDGTMELYLATAGFDATNVVDGPGPGFDAGIDWAYLPTGDLAEGGTTSGSADAWASNQAVLWFVNFDTGKIWVGTLAGGPNGDPEAGTGEDFTFAPNTPLGPAFMAYSNGINVASVTIDPTYTSGTFAAWQS